MSSEAQTPLFDGGVGHPEGVKDLLWSQIQRFRFIEFRLYWEGRVNRPALTKMFSISEPQATEDFRRYQELAPGNIEYDKKERAYVPTDKFEPKFEAPRSNGYLAHLRLIADHIEPPTPNWIGELPSRDIVPNLRRRLRPEVLRDVTKAIKHNLALQIQYRSFNHPAPHNRWISPHAIVFDGRRWHVRAFCHSDNDFRDFVFARMDLVRGSKPSPVSKSFDIRWFTEIDLELAPNPFLSEEQKEIVRLEYRMESEDCIRLKTRASLFFYMNEYFQLGTKPSKDNAMRVHLYLRNKSYIDAEMARIEENARFELANLNYQIG
jgi:WYL domain-containing protein